MKQFYKISITEYSKNSNPKINCNKKRNEE